MLTAQQLEVFSPSGQPLVKATDLQFSKGQLHALIGPSGCGKSTLLKGFLRLLPTEGKVLMDGQPIEASGDLSGRLGFVPQFSIAQPQLTVAQNINYARKLFAPPQFSAQRYDKLLHVIGLHAHLEKRVSQLSGGQLRRLGLALELISNPPYLICDEVTTGLDPASEEEILNVLRRLSDSGVTIICVIHNLAQLHFFDGIHLMKEGELIFQGKVSDLRAHYQVEDATRVYQQLAERPEKLLLPLTEESPSPDAPPANHPSFWKQIGPLVQRRFLLFLQDRSYLGLTLALTFGFPCLVVIFALGGLPEFETLSIVPDGNWLERLREQADFYRQAVQTGSLISGLIMFQVILLTLMGANNGAREIASERTLFEKEKLSGLNLTAYLGSKLVFFLFLSLLQGLWMTGFVKVICQFPGSFWTQGILFTMVVFSMSLVSLALSAISNSSEKASLLSTYIVGFQLPLSGVVLALPETLVWICRPFIAAYWGWSGYLDALADTRFYFAVTITLETHVASAAIGLAVLTVHSLIALSVVYYGLTQNRFGR